VANLLFQLFAASPLLNLRDMSLRFFNGHMEAQNRSLAEAIRQLQ
jgi:hypothetical protein